METGFEITTDGERSQLPSDGKLRILVLGDAVAPTGFWRVINSILTRCAGLYEIHQLGVNYDGDPHPYPWKIYPPRGDRHGFARLPDLISEIQPNLIFMLGDLWVLMQYAGILGRLPHRIPTIAYFPVESDPVEPAAMAHLLPVASVLATYTEFGTNQVRIAIRAARESRPELPDPQVLVVPHGIDTNDFYPLIPGPEGRHSRSVELARAQLFPGRPEMRDAFIVLNANRNQPRKRIDITLEAFALFAKNAAKNTYLYLHMARQDLGWDIQRLAARLGIADRLLLSTHDNRIPNESIARLNQIYNACDVGVNTACAEGWGLVSFEHAATGAAQIVPRHTSQVELWDGAAECVDPSFSMITENILTRAYYLAPAEVALALQRLYEEPGRRRAIALAGFQRSTQPGLSWDRIGQTWRAVFSMASQHSGAKS
jgi:glycosyltransferase involved in cell wall biosynthesis